MKRREFLLHVLGAAGFVVAGAPLLEAQRLGSLTTFLRPPGAVDESLFLKTCIGCYKCVEACRNDCLVMLEAQAGMKRMRTPVVVPRRKGCVLCMACTQACPTGALRAIDANETPSRATVRMGTAELNEGLCYSYNGRTCGICYQACPLQGKAMTIGLFERPQVLAEGCVGCGLCEQACVHLPQAVRVRDRGRFS